MFHFDKIRDLVGHTDSINRIAWSPDNRALATTSYDQTVRLWDLTRKADPIILGGPTDWITSVAWAPDGSMLAAGSGDNKIWIWDPASSQVVRAFRAHTRTIFSVAWSPDGKVLASASGDSSVALWHIPSLKLITMLQGHSGGVYRAAWAPHGRELATCSEDGTVRIWDAPGGRLNRILEGHTGPVYDLVWSSDGKVVASASGDKTIRLWGEQVGVLEGHTDVITSISFSHDGRFLASKSMDNTVRIWRCDSWEMVDSIPELASPYWTAGLALHPRRPVLATSDEATRSVCVWKYNADALEQAAPRERSIRYTSAKIVLVGDSGVGKTALANALLDLPPDSTHSTHGRHVLRFANEKFVEGNGIREMHEAYLWDLAGQPGYRLIHQLHLAQVVVAAVVFDVKSDIDPFGGVKFWARALRNAHRLKSGDKPLKMFLVAGRIDRAGVGISKQRIEHTINSLKFDRYFETSAFEGDGVAQLKGAIHNAIDWNALPKVSSTELFDSIKTFLMTLREKGRLLHTVDELYDTFLKHPEAPAETADLRAQFETCVDLLESQALIRQFSFGSLVLLQPEILDAYASAMISTARDEADSMGSIVEEDVLQCRFKMAKDERIKNRDDERKLLIATVEDLIRHEIALRDEDQDSQPILVFPSQSARPHPEMPEPDANTAIFRFEGAVLNIYATLAVRLWNSRLFASKDVFDNATFFFEADGGACQVYLRPLEEGKAELAVYFDEKLSKKTSQYVEQYVYAHLVRRASPDTVERRRIYSCKKCHTPVSDMVVKKRLTMNMNWVRCPVCETRVEFKVERESTAQTLVRQAMISRMDREADTQRERQIAFTSIQGKRLTGDFDIFFCHNGDDKPAVKAIGESLMVNGILPWLDEWELQPGQTWQPLVAEQINNSRMMAFFIGGNGIGPWQEQEVYMFLELRRPVIVVLLPDAPRSPNVPPFLKGFTWVDFRKDDPDPLDQFIWGITGERPRRDK